MTIHFNKVRDASQKRKASFLCLIVTTLLAGCDSSKPGLGFAQPGFPCEKNEARREDEPGFGRVQRLVSVIERRLALMPAVARWKWEHGQPIEDLNREAELIAAFVQRAEMKGLPAEYARRVITAQFDAAKQVQRDCFVRWKTFPPPKDSSVLDLSTQLRPRIDRLTDELLEVIVSTQHVRIDPRDVEPKQNRDALQIALSPWIEQSGPTPF